MTKQIINQNSFTAGEISPRLYSRSETDEYKKGLETASNCVITPHGPILRRPGHQYIAEVKDSSKEVRLIRYQFSQTLAYILEFGDSYIRFFKDGGQVLEGNLTITNITQANPGVITSSSHGLSNGDHVYITNVTGMTEINSATVPYIVANSTTNTFTLTTLSGSAIDTTGYTAYSSGGRANRIYEITSPWDETEVPNLQYVQNGATMYIVHPDYAPRTLTRNSNLDWKLETLNFLPPPTYESGYDPGVTLKPLATTGTDINVLVGPVNLTDGVTYQWTISGSGTNEFYLQAFGGGDPSVSTPLAVVENNSLMTEGTVGTLAAGEYDYGDNDTLGYSTIYVRLTDNVDPDSKASGYMVYTESDTLLTADVGRQFINQTTGETGRASLTEITNGGLGIVDIVEDFTDTNIIAANSWKLDLSPVCDLEFDSTQAGAIVNIRSEYSAGALGPRVAISAITNANPAVVTTSTAHELVDGDTVQVQDIVGMTEINDRVFTVNVLTSTTFELNDENTTAYTTYASGGIIRQQLGDINIAAFRSDDVGKYILANGGVMQIVAVNDSDDVDAEILKSLNSKTETGNWTLETNTWTSARGYPKAVGFFEQRLVFGGTATLPQTLWFSEIGIFDGFGAGPDDEDSIDIELSSNEVNEISWISTSRDLVVGTSGGELTINSGSSASISPSNIQQQPRTYHGSTTQQVVNVRDEILFLQNSGRKIRTFRYDFNIDGYTGEDLNFLAEHITEGGLDELVYVQEPDSVIYVVTTNGEMLAGTYDRSKKIIAWTKFQTDGTYENVSSVSRNERDEVWSVVKRTINASTKRYIELLDAGDGVDDLDGFSDSFLTLSDNIAITGITNANPAVVTTGTAHGFSNGDVVVIKDLVDPLAADLDSSKTNISSFNGCIFTVANKTSTTFELTTSGGTNVNTTNYNAYSSGGNVWLTVTALSGLEHLEGKTVQVKGDGAVQATKVVTNGAITAETAAGEFVVGLPYTTTIKTLDHEFSSGIGSMQGQRVRWARPLVKVYRSTRPLMNGEFLPNRSGLDSMNKKVPLFSGFLEYGPLDWSNSTALTLTLTDPLPLQISGITGVIESGIK